MAEALIRVRDVKGGVDIEVKFSPAIDEKSEAHALVIRFIKSSGMELLEAMSEPAKDK